MLPAIELDRIAAALTRPADEYPHHRLFLDTTGLRITKHGLHVPDGPWHVAGHPNRAHAPAVMLDTETPGPGRRRVEPHLTAAWRSTGLLTDQYGRPIHPDWRQLLADPRIGLPTGAGYFWRYGPNRTADAYVERAGRHGPEVLLIQRRSGQWALPGGFVDRGESSADAALRELAEETGLRIPGARAELVIDRRDAGPMVTLHAWTENTVFRITGSPDYLAAIEPVAGDDAADAAWVPLPEALGMDLFHTHSQYMAQITRAEGRKPEIGKRSWRIVGDPAGRGAYNSRRRPA